MARDGREDRDDALDRATAPIAGHGRSSGSADLPTDRLALPRSNRRKAVTFRDRVYHLRGSESRLLATVGTFRVVNTDDLVDARTPSSTKEDLRRLSDQGLIERRTIPINDQPTHVAVLTRAGKALLDDRQQGAADERRQQYHAGLVKPRELAHDAQLYRLYQAEASRIAEDGGRVTRVVLDYELKREYQTFLNRRDRPEDRDSLDDVHAFAESHQLPVIDDHLELPDLRLEVETVDGRHEVRDLELVTEHYSRAQLVGKTRAGFAMYRAAGAGRARGGRARTGGTPFDPHHLERLS